MHSVRWLAACLMIALLSCKSSTGDDPETGQLDIDGTWEGVGKQDLLDYRVEVTLEESGGAVSGELEIRESGLIDLPLIGIVKEDGSLEGSMSYAGDWTATFAGDTMVFRVKNARGEFAFDLIQNHPDFEKFRHPRVDSDGDPVSFYFYTPPEKLEDSWEVSTLEDEGVDRQLIESLVEAILAGGFTQTDSLLVARNGKLILEEYFYGNDGDNLHSLHSVTKSITSILFGMAIEEGHLPGVDDMVYDFFSDYPDTRWVDLQYPVSVQDALAMAGAIDWNESLPYTDPENPAVLMVYVADPVEFILDRDLTGTPGTLFSYNSGLTTLLGGVLASATGEQAADYARPRLFDPLGIQDVYWGSHPTGLTATGGGLALKERDLLKIGQMMLDGGAWEGKQIVPASWVQDSTAVQSTNFTMNYGYQWWLPISPVLIYQARGYGGQRLSVIPSLDLVVVQTARDYEGFGANPEKVLSDYILPAAGF